MQLHSQASHSLLYLIPHSHSTGWLLGEVAECLAAAPIPSQPLVLPDAKERYQGGSPSGKSSAEAHQQHFPSTCRQPRSSNTRKARPYSDQSEERPAKAPRLSLSQPPDQSQEHPSEAPRRSPTQPLTRGRSIRPRPDAALLVSPLTRARSVPPRPHALLPASPLARARSVLPRPHPFLPASPLLHGVHLRLRSWQRQHYSTHAFSTCISDELTRFIWIRSNVNRGSCQVYFGMTSGGGGSLVSGRLWLRLIQALYTA